MEEAQDQPRVVLRCVVDQAACGHKQSFAGGDQPAAGSDNPDAKIRSLVVDRGYRRRNEWEAFAGSGHLASIWHQPIHTLFC